MSHALVLLAHGSRDPAWVAPFERIVAHGARHVRVVPLFLGVGGHVRKDVPALVERARARHPGIEIEVTASLGEADALLDAVAAWIAAGT